MSERPMVTAMCHELKTDPEVFDAVWDREAGALPTEEEKP